MCWPVGGRTAQYLFNSLMVYVFRWFGEHVLEHIKKPTYIKHNNKLSDARARAHSLAHTITVRYETVDNQSSAEQSTKVQNKLHQRKSQSAVDKPLQ